MASSVEEAPNPAGPKVTRKQRVVLSLASIAIAIVLWLYVQVTVNPVDNRTFQSHSVYRGVEAAQAKGFEIQIPVQTVQVNVMGGGIQLPRLELQM